MDFFFHIIVIASADGIRCCFFADFKTFDSFKYIAQFLPTIVTVPMMQCQPNPTEQRLIGKG